MIEANKKLAYALMKKYNPIEKKGYSFFRL